jgi:hypothetical protein
MDFNGIKMSDRTELRALVRFHALVGMIDFGSEDPRTAD